MGSTLCVPSSPPPCPLALAAHPAFASLLRLPLPHSPHHPPCIPARCPPTLTSPSTLPRKSLLVLQPPPCTQVPNVMEFADWVGRTKQKHIHVTGTHAVPSACPHALPCQAACSWRLRCCRTLALWVVGGAFRARHFVPGLALIAAATEALRPTTHPPYLTSANTHRHTHFPLDKYPSPCTPPCRHHQAPRAAAAQPVLCGTDVHHLPGGDVQHAGGSVCGTAAGTFVRHGTAWLRYLHVGYVRAAAKQRCNLYTCLNASLATAAAAWQQAGGCSSLSNSLSWLCAPA